ncbi:MAG TPA: VWA domain-containing protein [Bryobacteraceae bacterium]|jgi:hypothetical protein|nr:VWA domain-containing protein [Bryobacteraceae bacterium]
MLRLALPALLAIAGCALAMDDPAVFKTDVALSRVDAQVLDREGHAVTGFQLHDFVLRIDGKLVPIRNFASENMPIDILLLLDVSGSMQPHVQRIASAAQQALSVLADHDRIAIMVFDTHTRVRLPFTSSHQDVTRELNRLLRWEHFDGGTHITRALLDAANYMQREARPDARRAIVILTDDETQDEEDEPRVESALARANAVLSFLQAPYEVPSVYGGPRPHGTWGGGGGWPGGGIGFPGGGPIILGRRGPGGGYGADQSHSAGTATIAQDSGGDTMRVDDAYALQDTLEKLRQRYTLYFYSPDAAQPVGARSIRVDLSQDAGLRYPDAEVHSRRVFMSGGTSGPTVVTRAPSLSDPDATPSVDETPSSTHRRRAAVSEDSGPRVNTTQPQ